MPRARAGGHACARWRPEEPPGTPRFEWLGKVSSRDEPPGFMITGQRGSLVLLSLVGMLASLTACQQVGRGRGTETLQPTQPAEGTRGPIGQPTAALTPSLPTASPPLPALPPVSCAVLGSTWSGGRARARQDGTGYDISGCTRAIAAPSAEIVKPAERDASRWAGARANDGTPFSFEVQVSPSGEARDWVIYLEGGGFCDDNAVSCRSRGADKSSTRPERDGGFVDMAAEGIFNRDPGENPTFHDANLAYAQYQSSDQWSGASTERRPTEADPAGWYFSGRANVRAMIEILIERYGLDDQNPQIRVPFIGTSAGGIGVQNNADNVAELLPRAAAAGRLKLVNDGGFATLFDDPDFRPGDADESFAAVLQKAYDFYGAQLNPLCEAAQRQAGQYPGRCTLGAVNCAFATQPPPLGLGLPMLVQMAQVDSSLMELHGIENLNQPGAPEAIEQMRAATLEAVEGVKWLFSAGDRRYHTIIDKDGARRGWNMGPEGMTFQEVLTRFWEGGPPERVIFGNP